MTKEAQVEFDDDPVMDALRDAYAGWTYIRGFHGDLYGVGWDRAQGKLERAIALRRAELTAAQTDAEKLLPHGYLFAKTAMCVPLLEEARDAITAITEVQRKRFNISPTLADRMDIAGTYSLEDWIASYQALTATEPASRASQQPAAHS